MKDKDTSAGAFLRRHPAWSAGIISAGLVQHIAAILMLLSIGHYFGIVTGGSNGKSRVLALLGIELNPGLAAFFWFFGAMLLLRFALGFAELWMKGVLTEYWILFLQSRLFTSQLQASDELFQSQTADRHIFPHSHDMKALRRYLLKGWLGPVRDGLLLLIACLVLFRLNATATAWLLGALALVALVYRATGMLSRKSNENWRRRKSELLRFIVKKMNTRPVETHDAWAHSSLNRFERRIAAARQEAIGYHGWRALRESLPALLLYGLLGGLLYVTAAQPAWQQADTFSYVLLLIYLIPALRSLFKSQQARQQGRLAAQSYERSLGRLRAPEDKTGENNNFLNRDVTLTTSKATYL